jgi:uncharacterized membrane protein YidH (DUF202 family)
MLKGIAVVLIVLGILGLAWGGFSFTQKEKAVDLGPIEVTRESTKSVPIPPIAGAAALLGGIALLVTSKKG